MLIEVIQKNGSTLVSTIEVSDSIIPRVGETLILDQAADYLQGTTELLVFDVSYLLKNNQLTPVVRCIARNGAESRLDLLEEHGWVHPA